MRLHKVSWVIPALLATTVEAQWRDLSGKIVPNITARRWFNTNDEVPTSEALRGKVWLLEFFATW